METECDISADVNAELITYQVKKHEIMDGKLNSDLMIWKIFIEISCHWCMSLLSGYCHRFIGEWDCARLQSKVGFNLTLWFLLFWNCECSDIVCFNIFLLGLMCLLSMLCTNTARFDRGVKWHFTMSTLSKWKRFVSISSVSLNLLSFTALLKVYLNAFKIWCCLKHFFQRLVVWYSVVVCEVVWRLIHSLLTIIMER